MVIIRKKLVIKKHGSCQGNVTVGLNVPWECYTCTRKGCVAMVMNLFAMVTVDSIKSA